MLLDICFARSRFCSGVPALPSTVIGALIVIGLETAPDPPDRAMEAPTVLAAVTKPPFAEVELPPFSLGKPMHPHTIALSPLGLRTGRYARLYLHMDAAIPCPRLVRSWISTVILRRYVLQT